MLGRRLFAKTLGAAVTCLALGFDPLARKVLAGEELKDVTWYDRGPSSLLVFFDSCGEYKHSIRLPDPEMEKSRVILEDCHGIDSDVFIGKECKRFENQKIVKVETANFFCSSEYLFPNSDVNGLHMGVGRDKRPTE